MQNIIIGCTVALALFAIAYIAFWPFQVAVQKLLGSTVVKVRLTAGDVVQMVEGQDILRYKGRAYRLLPNGTVTGLTGAPIIGTLS